MRLKQLVSDHRWAAGIVVLYLVLSLAYNIANPIHEATDEVRHYRYVRYLADFQQIPVQSDDPTRNATAQHPPLYYLTAALGTFWLPVDDPFYEPPINPHWSFRLWDVGTDNKNLYIPRVSPVDTLIAAHSARFVSSLWGVGAIVLTYGAARRFDPDNTPAHIAAMGIVAFSPMFLYLSAAVNNDVPVAAVGAGITLMCLITLKEGLTLRRAALLGAIFGAGLLTKLNLITMAAPIGLTLLLAPSEKNRIGKMALAVVVTLAVSGWWYIRNTALYGEPSGTVRMLEIFGANEDTVTAISQAIADLPFAWTTLWGRFGYGQIPLPTAVYTVITVISVVGLGGVLIALINEDTSKRVNQMVAVLGITLLANVGALFVFMVLAWGGENGRYVFPALPALAILVGYGLTKPLPEQMRRFTAGGTVGGFAVISLLALVGYLIPAYQLPPAAPRPEQTADIQPIGDVARILAYEVSTDTVQPGEQVDVTITWEVQQPTGAAYQVFVHLATDEGLLLAQRDTFAGLGTYPTNLWEPGHVFTETYRVFLPETAYAPEETIVQVGLFNPSEGRIPISDTDHNALALGEVTITAEEDAPYPNPTYLSYGGHFALVGYTIEPLVTAPGQEMVVTLYWEALEPPDEAYKVFLHIRERYGWQTFGAADGPPTPPTTEWVPGEVYTDRRIYSVPEGIPPDTYTLELGWYNDITQQRLTMPGGGNYFDLHPILITQD